MVNTIIPVLAATLLVTGVLTGTAYEKNTGSGETEQTISLQQGKGVAVAAGTYMGTIPCADCEGIKMELTLKEPQGNQGRTFSMKQTYLGKTRISNTTTEIDGKWFVARGNKQNPKAVVLQLIPSSGKYDPSYFVQVNKTQLKMLDRQQNEIRSKQNYTLRKQ